MRVPLLAALAVAFVAQATGPAQLRINQFPESRQIGVYYFETPNETQVWVNLEPEGTEKAGADPLFLNVTAKFPGKKIDRYPMMLDLRVQVRCGPILLPNRIWSPTFILTIGTDPPLNLSPNGRTSHFLATCGAPSGEPAAFDTVLTSVPFETVRRLADAKSVSIDAIGFAVRLRPEDFEALQTFLAALEHGAVVLTR